VEGSGDSKTCILLSFQMNLRLKEKTSFPC
jgi:hypothetical protein